jgi:galactose oxidase
MTRFVRGLALLLCLSAAPALAQGTLADSYSDLVQWRQSSGIEVTPIHVGLLPTGNLFLINEYNYLFHPEVDLMAPGFDPEFLFLMQPTPLGAPLPGSVLIAPLVTPPPFAMMMDSATNSMRMETLVCTGHAFMADGSVLFASGGDARVDMALYNKGDLYHALTVDGIADSLTLHPATNTWTLNPSLVVAGPRTGRPLRWYATVTRLADSRMLVTGGYERVVPELQYNPSVEAFDPAKNAWAAASGVTATPPGIENPDYTHVFQYPQAYSGFNAVLMIGGSGEPLFLYLDPNGNTWRRTGSFRPGAKEYIDANPTAKVFPNQRSSSALLPLRLPEDGWGYSNGSVINVGGEHATPMGSHIDVYDPASNAWRASIPMHGIRHHPSAVLLPDGRVLIIAGYDDESGASQTGYAEYVDPKNGFAVTQGSARMPETRGYHAVTVLLPDGRVLVGSGNGDGEDAMERSDFRYYYPDYMSKPRPKLLAAQEAMQIGGEALFLVPHGTAIGEVALLGLGAQTHSFDMNQRHVQLRLASTTYTFRLTAGQWLPAAPEQCAGDPDLCQDLHFVDAPAAAQIAPPGPYMLFILDQNRVPSMGKMVMLTGAGQQDWGEIDPGDRGNRKP